MRKFSERTISAILKQENAESITEFLCFLLNNQADDFWSNRFKAFLKGIMDVLVYLRDKESKEITIENILDSINFDNLIKIAYDPSIPEHIRNRLIYYIETLPNYKEPTPENPNFILPDAALKHHGYISMQGSALVIYV